MQRVEISERGRHLDLFRDPSRLDAIDLVQRNDDRRPGGEHPLGDEAVAGPDALVGGKDEQKRVHVLE